MEDNLKLYVIGRLLISDEDEPDESGIRIGAFPYEDFYKQITGREVDIEEEGYDEIEGVKEYLLQYSLSQAQLESIGYLGIDIENSAYETLVSPYGHYEPGGSTTVFSLEGIEQMPNISRMSLQLLAPACSLEPLTRLGKLEHIYDLTCRLGDFSPLLRLEALKTVRVAGTIAMPAARQAYKEIVEQLRARGVEVDDQVQ